MISLSSALFTVELDCYGRSRTAVVSGSFSDGGDLHEDLCAWMLLYERSEGLGVDYRLTECSVERGCGEWLRFHATFKGFQVGDPHR